MELIENLKNNLIFTLKKKYNLKNTEKIMINTSESHADFYSNVLFIAGKNRPIIEDFVVNFFKKEKNIENVEIAKPGFLNIFLKKNFWTSSIKEILDKKDKFGLSKKYLNEKINVEFLSTNPTGPLHVGHGRQGVLGDTIANILKAVGYNVQTEYYINDAGNQITQLAHSLYLRYLEWLGEPISQNQFTKDMYRGDYLIPIAKKIFDEYANSLEGRILEPEVLAIFRHFAVKELMEEIKIDMKSMNVKMDNFVSEQTLIDDNRVQEILDILKNDLYKGELEPPKDHIEKDYEKRMQTLFKSTKYGDDKDRALIKADGSWTYFASDIAYHFDKYKRGFNKCIDIFGYDHIGYVKRIKASVHAVTNKKCDLNVAICQMVNFLEKGKPYRMSKRSNTFIPIRDVIEDIGSDAFRFMLLSRPSETQFDFDFSIVRQKNKDNLVFYVQYAYARIFSVKKRFFELWSKFDTNNIDLLTDPDELSIIKLISDYPNQVLVSAESLEPHRIVNYLYNLASHFHNLWGKGREKEYRFINPDNYEKSNARLCLLEAIGVVIKNGMNLLGVNVYESM